MDGNQTIQVEKRGGRRVGAGRRGILKSMLADERFCQARGVNPLYAQEILARVVDERRAWQRILNSEDDRIVLQAMMFLLSMRDGKPAQQVNVTSLNLTLSASDVQKAREIVAEIRGETRPELLVANGMCDEVSNEVSIDMSKSPA